jgi:synaptic vesicle membrane protein VAT-1
MRAIVIHRPGGYDRLQVEERPDAPPGAGEVAVDVSAVGVNFADGAVRMGLYQSAKDYVGWPITPGFESAGVVSEVGPGVEDIEPGARVIAMTRFGGYATRVVVPRDQVFEILSDLGMEQAAAFSVVYLTAYYALFELAHPRAGADVLVHSAAGGVGGALLQLGRVADLRCVGVVGGPHKVDTAKQQGAAEVIDKSSADLWAEAERLAPDGFDVVLDANGVQTLKQSYEHLRPTGRLVVYGFATMLRKGRGKPNWLGLAWAWLRTPRFGPLEMTNSNRSVLAFNLSYLFEEKSLLNESMGKLLGWLQEGRIQAPPVTTYAFEDAAKAHRDIESGATVGKLVLRVDR